MKTKLIKYIKEIVAFFIILTIASNVISLYKSRSLEAEVLKIESAKLINNQEYNFDKNKPLLVHFWATWCPICKMEASNIEFLSKYYNVITIAVKSKTDKDIQSWMNKHNYDYKVINDENGDIANKFNVRVFPTTCIYDKNKNLVFSEVGYTSTFGMWIRLLWAGF